VPSLKVYNIVDQRLDFDYKPQFIARDLHGGAMRRARALPGDVLMNIVGPPLGKVAVVSDQYPE
jgi:type I restriction enzyme S subunit